MRAGRKISAIRIYREHTGMRLKEAKDAVDAMDVERRGMTPAGASGAPSGRGCGTGLLALCCVIVFTLVAWLAMS